jgi:hypothetical protein
MGKKLFLNVFYNIGIFVCLVVGYQYGIEQKRYEILFGAVLIIAIFVVLKIRLLKEVKNGQKKP